VLHGVGVRVPSPALAKGCLHQAAFFVINQ